MIYHNPFAKPPRKQNILWHRADELDACFYHFFELDYFISGDHPAFYAYCQLFAELKKDLRDE